MIETISATYLAERIDSGDDFVLVDTRPEDSYEAWHAPGAQSFPFGPTEQLDGRREDLESLIGTTPDVVFICGKGVSSNSLATQFQAATDAYEISAVDGGMNDWSGVYHHVPIDFGNDSSLEIVQLQRRAKGCLSYLVADTEAKTAIAFDPTADVEETILAAGERGLAIEGVVDSHVHADHVSGGRELADRLGVPYYLPERASGRGVEHAYEPLEDGQILELGTHDLRVLHTPGHTSEMISLVVDGRAVLTADTLHADAVGRTELEFGDDDAARGARLLHESLHETLLALGDDVFVLPGHVAVETDGAYRYGAPRSAITTTIGEARQSIDTLGLEQEEFVERIADAGAKPENYEEILTINRGADTLDPADRVELEIGPNNCSA